jgi:hypothetical protein
MSQKKLSAPICSGPTRIMILALPPVVGIMLLQIHWATCLVLQVVSTTQNLNAVAMHLK